MALWGGSVSDESKPKWLTAEEKSRCYATAAGWAITREDGLEEILVAFKGNLAGLLAAPTITDVYFANTVATYVQGANAHVMVVYNEKVVVNSAPTLVVNGSSSNATATYVSGNNTNKILFKFTVPASTQTLSLLGQTISGNIADTANTALTADLVFANNEVKPIRLSGSNTTIAVA